MASSAVKRRKVLQRRLAKWVANSRASVRGSARPAARAGVCTYTCIMDCAATKWRQCQRAGGVAVANAIRTRGTVQLCKRHSWQVWQKRARLHKHRGAQ